MIPVPLQYL